MWWVECWACRATGSEKNTEAEAIEVWDKSTQNQTNAKAPTSFLTISTYSDDVVSYDWKGNADEYSTGRKDFLVTLPDGTELPITVDYVHPWEFSIELPEESTVKPLPPPEEG